MVKLGVTHVFNTAIESPNFYVDKFVYKNVKVWDQKQTDLHAHFDDAHNFISCAFGCLFRCSHAYNRAHRISTACTTQRKWSKARGVFCCTASLDRGALAAQDVSSRWQLSHSVLFCLCPPACYSRSTTLVLAHLMKRHRWTFDQAFAYVKERRSQVFPNSVCLKLSAHPRRRRPVMITLTPGCTETGFHRAAQTVGA